MSSLKFYDCLRTGNSLVDSQHELLVWKINDCVENARKQTSRDGLISLLENILRCMTDHFENEEMVLLEQGLLTKPHLSQHAYAVQYMNDQIARLKCGDDSSKLTAQEIAFSLYDWSIDHIKREHYCMAWSNDTPPNIRNYQFDSAARY